MLSMMDKLIAEIAADSDTEIFSLDLDIHELDVLRNIAFHAYNDFVEREANGQEFPPSVNQFIDCLERVYHKLNSL